MQIFDRTLIEKIAEMQHIHWVKRQRKMGFHHPEECNSKDPQEVGHCIKCNKYITDYVNILPVEQDIEKDRIRNLPLIFNQLGYKVEPIVDNKPKMKLLHLNRAHLKEFIYNFIKEKVKEPKNTYLYFPAEELSYQIIDRFGFANEDKKEAQEVQPASSRGKAKSTAEGTKNG